MIDRPSPEATMPDLALLDELVRIAVSVEGGRPCALGVATPPEGHPTAGPFVPAHITAAGHSVDRPFELET